MTMGDLLPDPEPRPELYTLISVDDHLVEPPWMFEGRLPAALQPLAPHIIETPEGYEVWEFDGVQHTQVGLNAVAGRPKDDWNLEPARFDQIRPGCYQIDARIKDMDINGTWASLNFPSAITGFCGTVFSRASDPVLGHAVTQAWNDWFFEEWHSAYPERIIANGITWLADPVLGAAEIRRNAARGFVSVTLPERPQNIGLPSVFSGYWDPIIEACVETDTVINLHVGSSGSAPMPSDAPMLQLGATLFGQLSLSACAEWLWSGYVSKYPTLKIAMSEGGIGWVAMLMDRLDNIVHRSGYGSVWPDPDMLPSEALRRNFWFCTIDDPSTLPTRYRIGVENICLEVDYPHGDSTWPDTHEVIKKYYGDLPVTELRMMTHLNAAKLYRHPLPAACLP
jgi:predicted TIM-barrel fold metal-dependent hydrolase